MICSESFVEIPCLDESFMVTFYFIEMHFVPCVIVKKNNPLEFTIEVYMNLLHGQHFLIDINYLQAQTIIFSLLVNG